MRESHRDLPHGGHRYWHSDIVVRSSRPFQSALGDPHASWVSDRSLTSGRGVSRDPRELKGWVCSVAPLARNASFIGAFASPRQ